MKSSPIYKTANNFEKKILRKLAQELSYYGLQL